MPPWLDKHISWAHGAGQFFAPDAKKKSTRGDQPSAGRRVCLGAPLWQHLQKQILYRRLRFAGSTGCWLPRSFMRRNDACPARANPFCLRYNLLTPLLSTNLRTALSRRIRWLHIFLHISNLRAGCRTRPPFLQFRRPEHCWRKACCNFARLHTSPSPQLESGPLGRYAAVFPEVYRAANLAA